MMMMMMIIIIIIIIIMNMFFFFSHLWHLWSATSDYDMAPFLQAMREEEEREERLAAEVRGPLGGWEESKKAKRNEYAGLDFGKGFLDVFVFLAHFEGNLAHFWAHLGSSKPGVPKTTGKQRNDWRPRRLKMDDESLLDR